MQTVKRYMLGGHSHTEIRLYLVVLTMAFWGIIFCAWQGYPPKNHFSVTSETFSALGSFDDRHNPRWFWLFSLAMICTGAGLVPVVLYVRNRFAAISGPGAAIGAVSSVLGCLGMALVGCFPYAPGEFLGVPLKTLHLAAGLIMAVSFAFGMAWHALLLLKDRLSGQAFRTGHKYPYARFLIPYLICVPAFVVFAARIRWPFLWVALRAAINASTSEVVEAVHNAACKVGEVVIVEHVSIWALCVFMLAFTFMLPCQSAQK